MWQALNKAPYSITHTLHVFVFEHVMFFFRERNLIVMNKFNQMSSVGSSAPGSGEQVEGLVALADRESGVSSFFCLLAFSEALLASAVMLTLH